MKTLIFLFLVLFNNLGVFAQDCSEKFMDNDKAILYLDVDELPKFNSKDYDTVLKYIHSNMKYDFEIDVEWSIIVSFIVTKCGEIEQVRIERKGFENYDSQVESILLSMPKWLPGKKNNEPVNTLLFLPIKLHIY